MSEETKRLEDESTQRLKTEDEETQRIVSGKDITPTLMFLQLKEGIEIIDGKYIVEKLISSKGGEADIYLCQTTDKSKRKVVVKFYRYQNVKPKITILEKIKGINHPDIVELMDYGTWENRFFEVMEFAEGGSLADKMPFSEDDLTKRVVPEIVNALQFIHSKGIIHRDLKPSNLFYRDKKQKDVVLGDFGISSIIEDSEVTSVITKSHRTPAYTAPEIFAGIVSKSGEADYYSLGITLIHLLTGTNPFSGMADARILAIHTSEEVPLPDCSERFRTLLKGLLIKERKKRWGHNEIERWLKGVEVPVYKEEYGFVRSGLPVFRFKTGVEAKSMEQLAELMENDPETAKRHVGQGTISSWLKPFEQAIALEIGDVERSATDLDAAVVEIIYVLDPKRPYHLTKEQSATTPEELARDIDRDKDKWQVGLDQLYGGQISAWLKRTGFSHLVDQWNLIQAKYEDEKDAGLEAFLHILDPELGKPIIELNRKRINLGRIESGNKRSITLKISNSSRGYLSGNLNLEKNIEGIKFSGNKFKASKGEKTEITFSVNTSGLRPSRNKHTKIIFESNAQNASFSIPISYRVVTPFLKIFGKCLVWSIPGILIPLLYQLAYNSSAQKDILNLTPAIPLVILGVIFFGGVIGLWKSANQYEVSYLKVFSILCFILFISAAYLQFQPVLNLPEPKLGETFQSVKEKVQNLWFNITKSESSEPEDNEVIKEDEVPDIIEPGSYTGTITASQGASVRIGPNRKFDLVGTVNFNEKVTVLDKTPFWFKIQFGPQRKIGYIYEELISVPGWKEKIDKETDTEPTQIKDEDKNQKNRFSIIFDSNPRGATVFINDRRIGETPFMTMREDSIIDIRIELAGYQTYSERIVLNLEGINNLKFDLIPKN